MKHENQFKRYLMGPIGTLLVVSVLEVLKTAYHISDTLAVPFIALTLSAYFGGLISNLITAFIIAGYSLVIYPQDLTRVAQVSIAAFTIAIVAGVLKRRERRAWQITNDLLGRQSLESNLDKLRSIEKQLSDLIVGWIVLSDSARLSAVRIIHDQTAKLLTITRGWHFLYQERAELLREADKDKVEKDGPAE